MMRKCIKSVKNNRKAIWLMSEKELRQKLVRAIVLEYQNSKRKHGLVWGHENISSLFVLRQNRLRIARCFSLKYRPVSKLLFSRDLPKGKLWVGTSELVSSDFYSWVGEKFTHVGCTLPKAYTRALVL